MAEVELADQVTEQPTPETAAPEPTGPKTTRDLIKGAIKEVREAQTKAAAPVKKPTEAAGETKAKSADAPKPETKADDRPRGEHGHFAPTEPKPAAEAPKQATAAHEIPATKAADAQPDQASKPAGPPTSWSPEAKAAWSSFPPAAQMAIAKREDEIAKGAAAHQEERNRYRQIEQVIAPSRQSYQQAGIRSDAEAISRLMQWEQTIRSNPREGLLALGRNYGVNLSPQAQPQGQAEGQDQNEPPAYVRQMFDHLGTVDQRVNSVMSQFEQRERAATEREIAAFAKDKTHFDRVKVSMGMLMAQAAQLGNPIDLNEAYQRATWADPEVRAEILAEQQAEADRQRQEAAAKAAKAADEKRKADEVKRAQEAEAKRKASVSPKGSSGKAGAAARKPLSHSIRESILAAKSDIEGRA